MTTEKRNVCLAVDFEKALRTLPLTREKFKGLAEAARDYEIAGLSAHVDEFPGIAAKRALETRDPEVMQYLMAIVHCCALEAARSFAEKLKKDIK